MLKKNQNQIIIAFSIIIFLLIASIFDINNYFYFLIVFFIYGLSNRLFTKYSYFLVGISCLLVLLMLPIYDVLTIYMMLIMGIIGCIVGRCILLIKNKQTERIVISKKIKRLTFVIPFLILLIFELFYTLCNQTPYFRLSILTFIFSLILIYLIFLALYATTNNTFISNVILSILLLILFIVNQLKIYFTNEPLSATDMKLIKETGEIIIIIKGNVLDSLLHIRKETVILVFNIILLLIISKKSSYKFKSTKTRIITLVVSVVLLVILMSPTKSINTLIETNIYNDKKIDALSSLNEYYNSYGVIGGLYGNYLSSINYTEKLINDSDLDKIYSSVKKETKTANFKKPNIIVMFTESFWDITNQNTILFDTDPLKEYHKLKNEGVVINTVAPTFGGKSANNEFEFLTGGSLNYFSLGTIAYEEYYNKNSSKSNPTIIRELNNNGYTTQILNAQRGSLYNCDEVYKKMGVTKVNHLADELKYSVEDEYLTKQLINRFNKKSVDEKLFYMTISMESHMPYVYDKYDKFDFNIITNLDKDSKELVMAYTQSIRDASLELKKTYEYIKTLDEDTIIIFFGDHLPFLRTKDTFVYNLIDEFNTGDRLQDNYVKYNTETLILSNYDIKYNDLLEMSPDLILTTVINNMDIKVSNYYKWLYSTRKDLPASNALIAKDINGKLYSTSNMTKNMDNTYNLRKKLQQYLFK